MMSILFYALRNIHHIKEPTLRREVLLAEGRTFVQYPGSWERRGVSRIRTGDPLLAKQVLYQLSYNPA